MNYKLFDLKNNCINNLTSLLILELQGHQIPLKQCRDGPQNGEPGQA
jgi:hypothetical protein